MRKVLIYSLLLVGGLVISQFLAGWGAGPIAWLTMFALSFIMIHVGYEFEIDKNNPRQYLVDYGVAFTAAAFPWIFVAGYFVFVMAPPELWSHPDQWKESLLEARFASPTSAGVLFSMLAAAGLAATWMFKKARVLAIFDDLDTILLMIPLKIMMVGFRWQLAIIVVVIVVLLWLAWRYMKAVPLPVSWPFVMLYAAVITILSQFIYIGSKYIDPHTPIHLEVLLPAFVLGVMLRTPTGQDPRRDDMLEGIEEGPETPSEQRVSTIVSACFMVLVGLSMPSIQTGEAPAPTQEKVLQFEGVPAEVMAEKYAFPGWDMIALHVVLVTLLSNLGKMYPAFCYRREAHWKDRLAVAIGMFPRGEVGAGVLVVSISYGLGGPALTVAVLSLALNLLLTGVFILIVKKLLASRAAEEAAKRAA